MKERARDGILTREFEKACFLTTRLREQEADDADISCRILV